MHYWVRAAAADFRGTSPPARSGHSAVNIGKLKIIVFGGLVDKRFLNDITVYDAENKLWFKPECTGSGSDGQVGPSPRAFHVAVAIDCHMFIFGGRSVGGKRLGDFWVLDTDIWQWSELTSFGDLPSPRDFASAAPIGNQKIVMYGGWDGKKWLSDVYLMDTISLEWIELSVTGSVPPPRCGHTTTMVEKRLLVFGGRGSGGPIMGDLWALKGLIEEENERPGWTQLKLPGQPPAPRCGHTVTSGGHYLLLFGGHGTGGWLSRYDIYYSDCIVLDRVSVQWKRLPISNEAPPARAYHTMTSVGSRYLLFGGYDGKSTFGDFWWLVPDGDPIAKRSVAPSPESYPLNNDTRASMHLTQKGSQKQESAFSELWKKFEVSTSLSKFSPQIIDEVDDAEFIELASMLMERKALSEVAISNVQAGEVVREHWQNSSPGSVHLRELGPLLRDYQRLIKHHYFSKGSSDFESLKSALSVNDVHQFYHVRNPSQLRMDDIPNLLATYRELVGL